jgi:hypothetical protein
LLSKNLKGSSWVQREAALALKDSQDRRIIPVLLDDEAQNNLVWPLVADRRAIGPDVRAVKAAILEALPAVPRSSRRWLYVGLAISVLLMIGIVLLNSLSSRGIPPDRSTLPASVSFELRGNPRRGNGPLVGDTMIITASAAELLLVYQGELLVLRCPADVRCKKLGHGWKAELTLLASGAYSIVYVEGVEGLILTGAREPDLIKLNEVAKTISSVPFIVY